MQNGCAIVLAAGTTLSCALSGGIFFAVSSFITKALIRLAPAQGIAAMSATAHRRSNRNRS